MAILIQQDYAVAQDERGMRGRVRPQDIKSGTYYGQLQLRGSILAIKDSSTTASGYMAFGADMTTIPTSSSTGTGIYIDYSGIFGNNGGTPQFYVLSSDGKAYAGAGAVVLSATGIAATAGAIGGWSLGTDYIRDAANSVGLASTVTGGDDVRIWAGNTFANRATAPFRVTEAGVLVATSATVSGTITATAGSIGGWTITSTAISNAGGTVTMRGAGNLAFGATPPTAANVGTGIFINNTGIYGLASNTQNFYLQASDGKAYAGAGVVILDSNGLSIAVTTSSDDLRAYKFTNGGSVFAAMYGSADTGYNSLSIDVLSVANKDSFGLFTANAPSGKISSVRLSTLKGGVLTGKLELIDNASNVNYAYFSDIDGLMIGSSSNVPAEKLEVQTATANQGIRTVYTGASGTGSGPQLGLFTNDGAAMGSGHRIGQLIFGGYDGTAIGGGAAILTTTTEAWSNTAHGGQIDFYTVPNTTTTQTLRMTIAQDGAVTLDQGANDNHILNLRSSDVAHGMTTQIDTDIYGAFRKPDGDAGGLEIRGFRDASGSAGNALRLRGHLGESADTTKTINALAVIDLDASIKSGTTIGDVGADGNLVVIRNNATARFIFDAEGSAHADVEWTTFDTHDDLELLNVLNAHLTPDTDPLKAGFGEWMAHSRDELQRLKLVTFNDDGHHFLNLTRMHMLEVGALRQLSERIKRLEQGGK